MKEILVDCLPLELTYTIPKPFFTNPEEAHIELPPYFEIDPRNGVSSRSVPVHVEAFWPNRRGQRIRRPFKEIEFTLYGAIRSQINNRVTVQRILQSIELRKWSDFERHQRGKDAERRPTGGLYYCDLVFSIDKPLDSRNSFRKSRLLPSIDIRASKYVTQSTALNDQHLITGRCEVIYCVEARLISSDGQCQYVSTMKSDDIAARLARSSTINVQPNPSTVRLVQPRKLLKGEDRSFEVAAESKGANMLRMKQQCQSLLSGVPRAVQVHPKITFNIQQSLEQSQMVTTSSASTSTFTIPVTMTVSLPNTSDATTVDPGNALRQHLIKSGFPNTIEVASTWHTKYTFTNSAGCRSEPENTIENSTVRRDTHVLRFPPFYETSKGQYTATADLDISLLAGIPATSNYGLLKVQHFLSLAFEIGGEEMSTSQTPSHSKVLPFAGMTARNIRVECLVDV